jgi:hypothetical protein
LCVCSSSFSLFGPLYMHPSVQFQFIINKKKLWFAPDMQVINTKKVFPMGYRLLVFRNILANFYQFPISSVFSGRNSSTVNVLHCSEQLLPVYRLELKFGCRKGTKNIQKKPTDTTPRHQLLFHLSSVLIADWI